MTANGPQRATSALGRTNARRNAANRCRALGGSVGYDEGSALSPATAPVNSATCDSPAIRDLELAPHNHPASRPGGSSACPGSVGRACAMARRPRCRVRPLLSRPQQRGRRWAPDPSSPSTDPRARRMARGRARAASPRGEDAGGARHAERARADRRAGGVWQGGHRHAAAQRCCARVLPLSRAGVAHALRHRSPDPARRPLRRDAGAREARIRAA